MSPIWEHAKTQRTWVFLSLTGRTDGISSFLFSFSPSFFFFTGILLMVRWSHHSSSPLLLIEAAITGTKTQQKKTRVASVSCGLCSYFKRGPFFLAPLYSHNTGTTLGGVLSKTTNDEHDLTGYKTRRESHRKTITHQPLDSTVLFTSCASVHLFYWHNQASILQHTIQK